MFTADTDFQSRFGGTAFFYTHTYELAHAFLVEYFERVGFENAFFFVYFDGNTKYKKNNKNLTQKQRIMHKSQAKHSKRRYQFLWK